MSNQVVDNVTPFPNKAEIKNQAGVWFVRIETGTLSYVEINELQQWVCRSDFHREYLLEIAACWDDMGLLQELADILPLPEKESCRSRSGLDALRHNFKHYLCWPVLSVVVSVCVLVVLLSPWQALFDLMESQTYATNIGQRATHTLTDGTVVILNTDSELKVNFSETRRVVTLVRGEATFQVAKNPERLFSVYAGGGMVWAVGTAFNVRHSLTGVDVIVTEGVVKVFSDIDEVYTTKPAIDSDVNTNTGISSELSASAKPEDMKEALLDAGQSVHFSKVIETLELILKEDIKQKLAWQRGVLIFKGERLAQVINEISRYTNKEIIINDPFLMELRVGGHYKTDDIDGLLASLGEGLDINVLQIGNRILLSAKKSLSLIE